MFELPSGSKIAGIAAHIAIVAFFLPWIAVSCSGAPLGDASGYGMATGVWNGTFGPIETEPIPAVFLILAAAVLLALMFYVAYSRNSIGVPWTFSQIVIAVAALVTLAVITIKTINDNTSDSDATLRMSAAPQVGLLLTVGSFVTVILASYLAIVDLRRSQVIPLTTKDLPTPSHPQVDSKKCPVCDETIRADATVCWYCRSNLTIAQPMSELVYDDSIDGNA